MTRGRILTNHDVSPRFGEAGLFQHRSAGDILHMSERRQHQHPTGNRRNTSPMFSLSVLRNPQRRDRCWEIGAMRRRASTTGSPPPDNRFLAPPVATGSQGGCLTYGPRANTAASNVLPQQSRRISQVEEHVEVEGAVNLRVPTSQENRRFGGSRGDATSNADSQHPSPTKRVSCLTTSKRWIFRYAARMSPVREIITCVLNTFPAELLALDARGDRGVQQTKRNETKRRERKGRGAEQVTCRITRKFFHTHVAHG